MRAAAFTNTSSGSEFVSRNGRWLSDPAVVLRAKGASALLQLADPVYDAAAKTVTFQVCFFCRAPSGRARVGARAAAAWCLFHNCFTRLGTQLLA